MKTRSSTPPPNGPISPTDFFLGDVDDRAIIQAFLSDRGKPTVVCRAELDGTKRFEVSW